MTDNSNWSEDEFDLRLYNSMDAEGKRAWRAVFGLPKLLKTDNSSANNDKMQRETAKSPLPYSSKHAKVAIFNPDKKFVLLGDEGKKNE